MCNITAKMEVFLLSIIILSGILFIRAAMKTSFMLDMPALRQMMPDLFIRWIRGNLRPWWDVHTTRENNANNEMNSCWTYKLRRGEERDASVLESCCSCMILVIRADQCLRSCQGGKRLGFVYIFCCSFSCCLIVAIHALCHNASPPLSSSSCC